MPKEPKIRNFGHKKEPQYCEGNIWNILIYVSGGFLMKFLAKQHQAMLTLQGILFGDLCCGFCGPFAIIDQHRFFT
jgi:hypothetical protein